MSLHVLVFEQRGTQRRQALSTRGPIVIGRSPDCRIQLDSDAVSRRHAVVWVMPSALRVEDRSTNGTRAGERLLKGEQAEVPLGTPIVVGSYSLSFDETAEDGARPAPPPRAPALPTVIVAPSEAPTRPPPPATSRESEVALRREIHKLLLEHLDLATIDPRLDDPSLRPKVLNALRRIISRIADRRPHGVGDDRLVGELADEALGLGPLERFLADPDRSPRSWSSTRTRSTSSAAASSCSADARFTDDERVRAVIERIVTPLGRRIDESSPLVDARLRDGSRVNADHPPARAPRLVHHDPQVRPRRRSRSTTSSASARSTRGWRASSRAAVKRARRTSSSPAAPAAARRRCSTCSRRAIPADERIVTIEDAAELQLAQPHVVSLETRPPNIEGKGEYTIRDLVKNALRMRPDRIVVGECRGGEALDMLQAMNTGHDGSLTTTHANSPREAIARLETLVLMAGLDLPGPRHPRADRVERPPHRAAEPPLRRHPQGHRDHRGHRRSATTARSAAYRSSSSRAPARPRTGRVVGEFRATGYLPSFLDEFIVARPHPRGRGVPVIAIDLAIAYRAGAGVALAAAVFVGARTAVLDEDGPARRAWHGYVAILDDKLRSMFLPARGARIALAQLLVTAALGGAELLVDIPYVYLLLSSAAPRAPGWSSSSGGASAWARSSGSSIPSCCRWPNALKSIPSVSAAFQVGGRHVVLPLSAKGIDPSAPRDARRHDSRQEVLLHMSMRVGQPAVRVGPLGSSSSAVGRAATSRTCSRTPPRTSARPTWLESVLRTKTAEAKMQL